MKIGWKTSEGQSFGALLVALILSTLGVHLPGTPNVPPEAAAVIGGALTTIWMSCRTLLKAVQQMNSPAQALPQSEMGPSA